MTPRATDFPATHKVESFLTRHGLRPPRPLRFPRDRGQPGFRLQTNDRPAVIKWYGQDARALARLRTERAFCQMLWGLGCRQIPEPLAWDPRLRVGLFAWVAGRRLQTKDINLPRTGEALAFLMAVNRARPLAAGRGFPAGAGACFSVRGRLDGITRQVAHLARRAASPAAAEFIAGELEPAWQIMAEAIEHRCAQAGLRAETTLPLSERCLAPADFGFHQAILTRDDKLVFSDLAGAGWEDPAWFVSAFFSQPALPPPLACWDTFVRNFARALGQGPDLARRAEILLPAGRLQQFCRKWAAPLAGKRISAQAMKAVRKGLKEIAEPKWWR